MHKLVEAKKAFRQFNKVFTQNTLEGMNVKNKRNNQKQKALTNKSVK